MNPNCIECGGGINGGGLEYKIIQLDRFELLNSNSNNQNKESQRFKKSIVQTMRKFKFKI